jgi:hypothetical protein
MATRLPDFETQSDQLDRRKRAVSYDMYDITVRQLVDMASSREIDIAPDYQRHFVWDEERESELIESIFLGIPVPSLYMATNRDGSWEVVDGVQRLSTLIHFCGDRPAVERVRKTARLDVTRQEIATRFSEVRAYWSHLKSIEPPPPAAAPYEFRVGKGLLVVLLYGAFEFGVSRACRQVAQAVHVVGVRRKDVANDLYSLTMDPEIKSVIGSSRTRMWESRRNLFINRDSTELAQVYDAALAKDLSNLWCASLEAVYKAFGISGSPIKDGRNRGLIDQLVDHRNAVAHGRESASRVGQSYSTADLDDAIARVESEINHVISDFDGYLSSLAFVHSSQRWRYERRR